MGDDITIGVTEIVNNIEVTAQPNDQIVDISVIDNTDEVTLNITPTVIEINVNKGSSYAKWGTILGTLSDQTDLQNALNLKADLVDGKVPSSQLPSYVDDVIEVDNYAALPVTGESGKIYVTIDNNHIFRWTGSTYVEITDNTVVWGAITGTLSSQTDLQSALNAKFNNPTGDTTQYIAGDGSLITFPTAGQAGTLVRQVRNTTGSTLTKGTIVYISGANGNKPIVSKAIATGDSTSAQTFGMLQADLANNSNGYVVCIGDITGLDTSAITEGTQLYLSSTTAGAYTTTKQVAPAHLVYIGVVTRSHPTQGQIEVKIQNGYELDEIHDVLITSKTDKDILTYESSSSLWKNKSLSTILGYTPANDSNVVHLTGNETISGIKTLTGGSLIFNNSSDTFLTFQISGTQVGNISVGSTYFQLSSKATGGYLFKNIAGSNALSITDSGNGAFLGSLTATSIIKSGGTSSQFLKADGSVDSSTYYLASNPNGYTSNVGTVTSVSALNLGTTGTDISSTVATGTTTPIITLNIPTASATNRGALSSTDWSIFNNKQTALSGTGFVKISGSTISYDNSAYVPTSRTLTINGTTYDLSANRSWTISAGISGSGTTGKIPKFTSSSAIGDSSLEEQTNSFFSYKSFNIINYLTSSSTALLVGNSNSANIASVLQLSTAASSGYLINGIDYLGSSTFYVKGNGSSYFASNVGIGTTAPTRTLDVNGEIISTGSGSGLSWVNRSNSSNISTIYQTSSVNTYIYNGSGNVANINMSTGIYTPLSDKNKKKDFEESNIGLNEILNLKPTLYRMKDDSDDEEKQLGFIAQEVKEFIPQAYVENDDFIGLNFNAIVAALVKAIQELKSEIDLLKTKS